MYDNDLQLLDQKLKIRSILKRNALPMCSILCGCRDFPARAVGHLLGGESDSILAAGGEIGPGVRITYSGVSQPTRCDQRNSIVGVGALKIGCGR